MLPLPLRQHYLEKERGHLQATLHLIREHLHQSLQTTAPSQANVVPVDILPTRKLPRRPHHSLRSQPTTRRTMLDTLAILHSSHLCHISQHQDPHTRNPKDHQQGFHLLKSSQKVNLQHNKAQGDGLAWSISISSRYWAKVTLVK